MVYMRDVDGVRLDTIAVAQSLSKKAGANTAVVLGDSVSSYDGIETQTYPQPQGDGWFPQLCFRSNLQIEPHGTNGGMFAFPGYTSAQIAAELLPEVLALDPAPAVAFVCSGHNDDRTTEGLATSKAAYLNSIILPLLAAGIQPVICTIMPISNGRRWNRWLVALAQSLNLPALDLNGAVASPTGGMISELTYSAPHPNSLGYKAIAVDALTNGVLNLFPPALRRTSIASDDETNLLAGRGIMNTDANGDGLDDRWTGQYSGATYTLATPSAGEVLAGNWQCVSRTTADAGADQYLHLSDAGGGPLTAGWSVGDELEFTGRFKASGFEQAPGTETLYYCARLAVTIGSTSYYIYGLTWRADVTSPGATFKRRWTIGDGSGGSPAGGHPTKIDVELRVADPGQAAAPLNMYWGEITLVNLTSNRILLGIDA